MALKKYTPPYLELRICEFPVDQENTPPRARSIFRWRTKNDLCLCKSKQPNSNYGSVPEERINPALLEAKSSALLGDLLLDSRPTNWTTAEDAEVQRDTDSGLAKVDSNQVSPRVLQIMQLISFRRDVYELDLPGTSASMHLQHKALYLSLIPQSKEWFM